MSIQDTIVENRNVVIAVAAVVLLAGVGAAALQTGLLSSGEEQASDVDASTQVPGDVEIVMHVDMDIIDDENTRTLVNSQLEKSEMDDEPQSIEEAITEIENESELQIQDADEIMVYGQNPETTVGMESTDEYIGIIMHGAWSEEDFVAAFNENNDDQTFEETTYKEQTLYVADGEGEFQDDMYLGVLGNGQFVAGSEDAVKDALDVEAGDASAWSGELRSKYDNTRDGYITFAMDVPQDELPEEDSSSTPIDTSAFSEIEYMSGVYYTSGDNMGMEMDMNVNGTESAQKLTEVTDGALSLATGFVEDEQATEALRNIEVSRDESTVSITFEDSVSNIQELIEYFNSMGAGTV